MTEQQTLDREKKIAEIRDVVEHRRSHSYYEMVYNENHEKYIRFLLDELERLERAAHNAHVTELEQERDMYKSSSEVFYERLKKEAEQREKLVECLRFYERMARGREANDGGRRARTIFAEIGVTVE